MKPKTYTINALAKLAGVSVRTLHHYDEIGLLRPKRAEKNGYRLYGAAEVARLQHILFFRELDFSLEQISSMVNSPQFEHDKALREQLRLLTLKKERLEKIMKTVQHSLQQPSQKPLSDAELYQGLTQTEIDAYKTEVRQKYGEKRYEESQKRARSWSPADFAHIKEEGARITHAVADHMEEGPTSATVQALMEEYFAYMQNFYDCSLEVFAGLGQLYVEDERFTHFYEQVKPGLAQFMQQAMKHFSTQKR